MKQILISSLVMICLFVHPGAAQEKKGRLMANIGLQPFLHTYEEPGVMKNEGAFMGVSYGLRYENRVLLALEGTAAYGRVDYTSTRSGNTDDIEDIHLENRLLIGWIPVDRKDFKLTLYTGYGFRFLEDDSQGKRTSTGALGYTRESSYHYSPVGLSATFFLANGWRLTPRAEYDWFWGGKQESRLGYIAGFDDITNDQEDGYGYRFSLTLEKAFRNSFLSITPFYRYWDIDASELSRDSKGRTWVEPGNETREMGVTVSVEF